MIKNEQQSITKFVAPWLRTYKNKYKSVLIEGKYTKAKSINDNSFEPQQLPVLRDGVSHKIADGVGSQKPIDLFAMENAYGFIGAVYLHNDNYVLCIINVKDWDKRDVENVDCEYAKKLSTHWYTLSTGPA